MRRASTALVVALASLGSLLPLSLVAAGSDVIQPGDRMLLDGETNCTLSFVFDGVGADAGRVFLSIASHCVVEGESMSTDNFADFGTVVYKGDQTETATDIALIEVAPAFHESVLAEVRGHPGFPTGVALAGSTAMGDRIVMSGWGTGFGELPETREERVGLLLRHQADVLRLEGPVTPGDSGGPWTMEDGRAVAIVSKIEGTITCCDLASLDVSVHQEGPTVERILATAAANGFDIELRTA